MSDVELPSSLTVEDIREPTNEEIFTDKQSTNLMPKPVYSDTTFTTQLPESPEPGHPTTELNDTNFRQAMLENAKLRNKLEFMNRLIQRRRGENEVSKVTVLEKKSRIDSCGQMIKTFKARKEVMNVSVEPLKAEFRSLRERREACKDGSLLRSLQAEGSKINKQRQAVTKQVKDLDRRSKDLQFQNNRLSNDVARLRQTHETREKQTKQLTEKLELLEIQNDSLQAQVKGKTSQINKIQGDLEEVAATPPPEDIKQIKLTTNLKRLAAERENEIYLANEMIKKWHSKFEEKTSEVAKVRRLSPLKEPRRTRSMVKSQQATSMQRTQVSVNKSATFRSPRQRKAELN